MRALLLTLTTCVFILPAQAQYSGGSGTADDPYQIATAADLIALGETPDDYDKHFILTAEIDLDPNLPGGKVFASAVIARDANPDQAFYQGPAFSGVFDGNGHQISNLTISRGIYLGLFGELDSSAIVSNLGMEAVDINGTWRVGGLAGMNRGSIHASSVTGRVSGDWAGGLVGCNAGAISNCCSTSTVAGDDYVGGLVGLYSGSTGGIAASYSTGSVRGDENVGGLVGFIEHGSIATSYSSATVTGNTNVGGLVGENWGGIITMGYSTGTVVGITGVGGLVGSNRSSVTSSFCSGTVSATSTVGGLVGENSGSVFNAYSAGSVSGDSGAGGLVGGNQRGSGRGRVPGTITASYSAARVNGNEYAGGLVGFNGDGSISSSFWNTETSGQPPSDGGVGLTIAEMQTARTFLEAGWDFVGETENGTEDIWKIVERLDYPRLWWEKYGGGAGEPNDPYLIYTAEHLNALGAEPNDYDKHFKLMADIDLTAYSYDRALIAPDTNDAEPLFQGTPFTGVFDGNNHTISNLTIAGGSHLGLFGATGLGATISNLGLEAVDVNGTGNHVGGLVGGSALVGRAGSITASYSTGVVSGEWFVGGLMGLNCKGSIAASYSTGTVNGYRQVGGLVGDNKGGVTDCYAMGHVTGSQEVGGLVGQNGRMARGREAYGTIANCYSSCSVSSDGQTTGGLVGSHEYGENISSFWDVDASGQTASDGGTGLSTAEMQTVDTFLDAGWDFVCEVVNGVEDIWWMSQGDYPRLVWEVAEVPPCSGVVVELDETNFGETIAAGVVLVDFYATWCSHCRTQAPILDDVAGQVGGKAVVGKLDIDEARSVAQTYGVSAIPTLIVFKNGDVFERFLGVTQGPVLVAAIQSAIDHEETAPRMVASD